VKDLTARYHDARLMQVECWSDELIVIANRDDLDANDKRVRVDPLKWLMSKIVPRRYSDRFIVAGEAENPMHILHQQVSFDSLTSDQLDDLERFTNAELAKKARR
jgi:hypothetical protein